VSASEPLLDAAFLDDFAHRWLQGWNAHDGEAVAALCTEGVEFSDPLLGTVRGRAAVAGWVRSCAQAFPDYRFEEPERPYLSRDAAKAIVPWRMIATNTGPIDPPGFAPTGRSIVVDGVDHWWFGDGLVERYRADYDAQGLSVQLGLAPAPGSRTQHVLAAAQRLAAKLPRRRRGWSLQIGLPAVWAEARRRGHGLTDVVFHGPTTGWRIALTVDDGTSAEVVAG
jgi:hypothetical protein